MVLGDGAALVEEADPPGEEIETKVKRSNLKLGCGSEDRGGAVDVCERRCEAGGRGGGGEGCDGLLDGIRGVGGAAPREDGCDPKRLTGR